MIALVRGWLVVDPEGEPYDGGWTFAELRSESIGHFLGDQDWTIGKPKWRRFYDQGYRCIRVSIIPEGL